MLAGIERRRRSSGDKHPLAPRLSETFFGIDEYLRALVYATPYILASRYSALVMDSIAAEEVT